MTISYKMSTINMLRRKGVKRRHFFHFSFIYLFKNFMNVFPICITSAFQTVVVIFV